MDQLLKEQNILQKQIDLLQNQVLKNIELMSPIMVQLETSKRSMETIRRKIVAKRKKLL